MKTLLIVTAVLEVCCLILFLVTMVMLLALPVSKG